MKMGRSSVLLQFSACATCWFLRTPGKGFSYVVQSQALTLACLFCLRHTNSPFPRISYTTLLLFCPSVVRKSRCTVLIDSVLASRKTQKDFCSPEDAMFLHYRLLVEKRVTKPSSRHKKKTRIFTLFTDTLSSPVDEFISELQTSEIRRELWNTVYFNDHWNENLCNTLRLVTMVIKSSLSQ
jgi:hypothetical protein